MQELIDDFVAMNQQGLVLELCEKYYDDKVLMLNNGAVFARSMRESYEKQKGFVESVKEFDIELISQIVEDNYAELTFDYKMIGEDSNLTEFMGKHIQTWKNGKIRQSQLAMQLRGLTLAHKLARRPKRIRTLIKLPKMQ